MTVPWAPTTVLLVRGMMAVMGFLMPAITVVAALIVMTGVVGGSPLAHGDGGGDRVGAWPDGGRRAIFYGADRLARRRGILGHY